MRSCSQTHGYRLAPLQLATVKTLGLMAIVVVLGERGKAAISAVLTLLVIFELVGLAL